MKLNKGKVHPSPSSSSSSSSRDPISSLNHLLPTAILTLISALSLQDREVLAYMITRSLKSSTNLNPAHKNRKKKSKKFPTHNSPSFDCDCFDCYTSFWYRWDSSPHRELIHQAIEVVEDHLATTEMTDKNGRTKRKLKVCRPTEEINISDEAIQVAVLAQEEEEEEEEEESTVESVAGEESTVTEEERESLGQNKQVLQEHKGLARKVLPDVIGLFNSRLWSLWGPAV